MTENKTDMIKYFDQKINDCHIDFKVHGVMIPLSLYSSYKEDYVKGELKEQLIITINRLENYEGSLDTDTINTMLDISNEIKARYEELRWK